MRVTGAVRNPGDHKGRPYSGNVFRGDICGRPRWSSYLDAAAYCVNSLRMILPPFITNLMR